ncbi:hypothetical protein [Pseudomonas sp. NBRC 111124]|uniref:hypothetical protein n=1 Tax=Pseudomonas sp. NBRC 111124 TaxID=1661039 RepID=UPI0007610F39|nr:hypothetical protein [Pseudomonas sp. NBRC 111124]
MTNTLSQRLALYSNLNCQVATRFAKRPTLHDAADHMLREQWQAFGLSDQYEPADLNLVSNQPQQGRTWIRPLAQAVVERYCQPGTLHLTQGEDYLTRHSHADPGWALDIDLLQVQQLINQISPFLIEGYSQLLVNYWSQPDSSGETPWQWYEHYLKNLLSTAIETHRSATSLAPLALATVRLVHDFPQASQRNAWANTRTLGVSELSVDYSADGKLDVDLASAILLERSDGPPPKGITLLYTLSGRLLDFDSRQALLHDIGLTWPLNSRVKPRQVALVPSTGNVFAQQALGMLTQQLRVIEQVGSHLTPPLGPLALNLQLDRLTAMLDQCSDVEVVQRTALNAQLPEWLRNAESRTLLHYGNLLADIAQAYHDVNGQFWLDGIDSAEDFANHRLAARFEKDHPGTLLKPEHVRVVNYQTTAVATPGQEAIIQTGEVTPVTFTLAQLAIGNLGLLKPGRVAIANDGQTPLPGWLDETYVRTVISELDIGSAYPAMLRKNMLDDPLQHQERQQLLTRQLRSQLPSQALELHLRGKDVDKDAAEHIALALNPQWSSQAPRWVMRPLGFIKSPGATIDHPYNTWLIEAETPAHHPCLLYRPMHEDTLLQFKDRMALFVAISTPGELQDDLLHRLPPEIRRFYAHGGFLQPHLFTPLDYSFVVPLSTPAPVQLAVEPALDNIGEKIYQACVAETISRFEEHSSTSSQTRLTRVKDLAWLVLNSVLPFAGKVLNRIAWLFQMEAALAEYIEPEDAQNPTEHRLALVNLLVNVAMLLFSHSLFKQRLEQEIPAETTPVMPLPALPDLDPGTEALPPELIVTADSALDASWSHASAKLDNAQRGALMALRAPVPEASLGSAIALGALRGLHLYQNLLYAVVEGQVYEVAVQEDTQQVRILGADGSTGPWLKRDANGAWQLDLGLRLRAGMPLGSRIFKAQEEKRQEREAVAARVREATTRSSQQSEAMVQDLEAMMTEDPNLLQASITRLQAQADFWEQYLKDFERLDTLSAGTKNFKINRAKLLYQAAMARQAMHSALRRLYKNRHDPLLQLAQKQNSGDTFSAADVEIIRQRLDDIAPLLDTLIGNATLLSEHQTQLQQLTSLSFPEITTWYQAASRIKVTSKMPVALRFMRLESLINRIEFVHHLSSVDSYWLHRFWQNTQLLVSQRLQYLSLGEASDEARVRLLQGQAEQPASARRQLQHIEPAQLDAPAKLTLSRLENDLAFIDHGITTDLGNLPAYPPTVSVAQLRSQLPGLIETSEHGLLLGEPRQDDASIIDIAGPDSHVPGSAYHMVDGGWVQIQAQPQPEPAPAATGRSLKRLLKESNQAQRKAREHMAHLERQLTGSYLPVEIEEQINQQREDLLAHINAIEARLTADNQTDEATQAADAARVVRALYQQAEQLQSAAPRLRTQAALAQLPRMGDLQYLIEQGQVQVSRLGARMRTARVKGRPADFFDEYAIVHEGKALWYAHFHYPAMDSPKSAFIVGHLKTAAQRYLTSNDRNKVHRGAITAQAAQRYFFNLA